MDGVADGHRWQSLAVQRCTCGAVGPRRDHFFWNCPVAMSVVKAVQTCCPGQPELSKHQIWLMQPPVGVSPEIWAVVCLAALSSMDGGRRKLLFFKLHGKGARNGDDSDFGSRSRKRRNVSKAIPSIPKSRKERVFVAGEAAVADFWGRIADFSALRDHPKGVGISSPFLKLVNDHLKLNRSPG